MNLNKLKKISGDASFRTFYRNKNSIIVYCKKSIDHGFMMSEFGKKLEHN